METLPTTWEQICAAQGIDPNFLPAFLEVEERFRPQLLKDWQQMHIAEALNGKDWKPDYSNSSQYKYFPYFLYDGAAGRFRFHLTHYAFAYACAGSGARHVFKDRETAKHAGIHFEAIFNDRLIAKD